MGRKGIVVAGLVGVIALGISLIAAARAGAPRPTPAEGAGSYRERGRQVAAEGRVVTYPGGEVVVGTERGGRLLRVLVDEGQTVAEGALLAEFESEELMASIAEASAHVAELDAEVHLAEVTLRRRQGLAAEKIVSQNDLDQAERDLETSRARAQTARSTLARYEAQLRKTRILAPISGTVIARHVQGGEMIDPGARVVTMADLGHLRIEGEADEADAGALAVGAKVQITSDGFPGQSWRGQVEEIPDAVTLRRLKPQDPARPTDTRILAVKVAFREETPLRLGTTVELRIDARTP